MKNRAIYEAALRLLAESTIAEETADYEDRAPYLIATFCTEMSELDIQLRSMTGDTTETEYDRVYLSLDDVFPLTSRLSSAAILYLAAMLILESDEERSDKLYEQYSDAVSRIIHALPATLHPIINKYY